MSPNRHTQTQPTQEELSPLASTSEGHVVPQLQPGKHVGQRCCPAAQRSKRICPGWTWSPSTDKTDRTLAASPEHSAQFVPPHLCLSCLLAALCPFLETEVDSSSPVACVPVITLARLPDFPTIAEMPKSRAFVSSVRIPDDPDTRQHGAHPCPQNPRVPAYIGVGRQEAQACVG